MTLLEVAQRSLHVREQPPGSNRSPEIDAWLLAVHAPLGSPWCCAAVTAWGREALGSGWKFKPTASVAQLVQAAGSPFVAAEPGYLVVFYFPSLKRYAHIGVVSAVSSSGIETIEANTIPDGAPGSQREGWGCFARHRPFSANLRYLRP